MTAVTIAVLAMLAGSAEGAGARPRDAVPSPPVVALMGEPGSVNILHEEFATPDGRDPMYPAGMPRPVRIVLPKSGSFAGRLAALKAGPLGRMRPGTLYAVAGTRLLLLNASDQPYDGVGQDRLHATGVADSVVGSKVGTAPKALAVVVLGGGTDAAYGWLARQPWIDLASTSTYTIRTLPDPSQCAGAASARAFSRDRVLFSSSGNTTDQPEALISPNGLPETYLVGGVDSTGQTWRPGHVEEPDPLYAVANVVRPYETGELFSYQAAAPDSTTGRVQFGGTSGATPRTAGWAAALVAHARATLRAPGGTANGALASGTRRPARGPLADGRLDRDELVALMHAVAVQRTGLPPGPAYAAEGYGALDAAAIARAEQILDGNNPMPSRPADDTADSAARQVRQALFSRCS